MNYEERVGLDVMSWFCRCLLEAEWPGARRIADFSSSLYLVPSSS